MPGLLSVGGEPYCRGVYFSERRASLARLAEQLAAGEDVVAELYAAVREALRESFPLVVLEQVTGLSRESVREIQYGETTKAPAPKGEG